MSYPPNAMAVLYEQWVSILRKYNRRKNETNKKSTELIGHSGEQPHSLMKVKFFRHRTFLSNNLYNNL